MSELPKAAIVRLAKKAGAERIGDEAAEALLAATEEYVAKVALEAAENMKKAGRKTLKAEDITA